MSENREEILADFQACTGIEDVAEAIFHLDETNWDLLRAVSRVMPPDTQSFQPNQMEPDVMIVDDDNTPAVPVDCATDIVEAGNNVGYPVPKFCGDNQPSTSSSRKSNKKIKFDIQYRDRILPIEMNETSSIYDLKRNLQRDLNVAPCRLVFSGWAKLPQNEKVPFSKLNIEREKQNVLHVSILPTEGGVDAEDEAEVTDRLNSIYTLNIKFESSHNYNLKYPGTTTILEVKNGLYALTNIEVRNQIWSGWPPNIDDQTVLALSGIDFPEHNFTMCRQPVAGNSSSSRKTTNNSNNIVRIDSDDEEYEDASESFTVDDDYFVDEVAKTRTEPLIPDNVEDEIVGSLTFGERFTARYGPVHPGFFQGTLEDALGEACNKPAKDRKIFAIYLHHDSSVLTNVFCTQLLGFESVMQMFENNFILWGWDLTFDSNFQRLQNSVQATLGPLAKMSLRNMPVDRLPAIVLIMRIRSSTDIFGVIHGNVGVNELLTSLLEAVEVFSEHQRVEIREEQERAERELVKWEQDEAYRESLEADRAKEEAKRNKEKAETEARVKLETEQAEVLAKKEAHRAKVEATLPPEPPAGNGDTITKIRVRLPQGEFLERRFDVNTPLNVLVNFVIAKGYPNEEFKIISSWPRRDLTALDQTKTLKDLKLFPQETVILEER